MANQTFHYTSLQFYLYWPTSLNQTPVSNEYKPFSKASANCSRHHPPSSSSFLCLLVVWRDLFSTAGGIKPDLRQSIQESYLDAWTTWHLLSSENELFDDSLDYDDVISVFIPQPRCCFVPRFVSHKNNNKAGLLSYLLILTLLHVCQWRDFILSNRVLCINRYKPTLFILKVLICQNHSFLVITGPFRLISELQPAWAGAFRALECELQTISIIN